MNLRDIFLAGAFAQGGGGAVSPEQITEAVNSYLDKNPVESYKLPVANATTLGGVKPVTATSDMTQDVGVDANGKLFTKPGEGGVDLAMTGAEVGQIAKITAVDASGVPTAWEPVDMPSGGGGDDVWELMATVDMVQDATYAQVSLPAPVKKLLVYSANGNALLTATNIMIRLATGSKAYNNEYFGSSPDTANNGTWNDLTIYVDFTISEKPFQLTTKSSGSAPSSTFMEYCRRYDNTMTPQSFYITTANGTGVFNEKKFTVYGVRA